jgi:hypothetical protein
MSWFGLEGSELLIGVDIHRNEISVLTVMSVLKSSYTGDLYITEGENTLLCVKRRKVWLTNCVGGNADGGTVFNHLLTYYF